MPQLSLYIDENTLKKIEIAAKLEKISISKYVVSKLNESMYNAWPKNYDELYGAINDESFAAEKIDDFSADAKEKTYEILSGYKYLYLFPERYE